MKRRSEPINLLELQPARLFGWEDCEDENVVVLVPKFRHSWLRWLQERLKKKYFHVKLDPFGSHIWRACDGKTKVATIAESFRDSFGDVPELYERIAKFLGRLERDGLLRMKEEE